MVADSANNTLPQVLSYNLFSGEVFQRELHLVVTQSDDEQHVIVQGCM